MVVCVCVSFVFLFQVIVCFDDCFFVFWGEGEGEEFGREDLNIWENVGERVP